MACASISVLRNIAAPMSKTSSSSPSGKGAAALVSCAVGLLGIGAGFAGAKLLQILRKKSGIANSITETIGASAHGNATRRAQRNGTSAMPHYRRYAYPCVTAWPSRAQTFLRDEPQFL